MNSLEKRTSIPTWLIVFGSTCLVLLIFIVLYYITDPINVKLIGIFSGIVSGLSVYFLTNIWSLSLYNQLDNYKRMGIKGILKNRHDKDYYQKIVSSSTKLVRVMGASCTRFVEDFADIESDDKVLICALRKNPELVVQLLIPEQTCLSVEAKARIPALYKKLDALVPEFKTRIKLRHFSGKAQHSFVIVDDNLISGPIFEDDKSKYAPAVHVEGWTDFAQKYSQYFDRTWENAIDRS